MANKLYEENHIQEIANAIREKNGSTDTYMVSQMGEAIRSIPSGGVAQHGFIKESSGTITDTTIGQGSYKTLFKDSDLAEHRTDESLWCHVVLDAEPQPYTILEVLGFNKLNNVVSGTQCHFVRRLDASSNESRTTIANTITTDSPAGVGCIQITSDGEVRLYSNSASNYAIRPCNYRVAIGW